MHTHILIVQVFTNCNGTMVSMVMIVNIQRRMLPTCTGFKTIYYLKQLKVANGIDGNARNRSKNQSKQTYSWCPCPIMVRVVLQLKQPTRKSAMNFLLLITTYCMLLCT